MAATVSTKRSSPPADSSLAAPTAKLARLDSLPTQDSSLIKPAPAEPQHRGPKIAALFKKPHERDPAPMRGAEASFVDTHFDVEDAVSYQDALLVLESLANRMSYLTRHQTRLLISLCLFPSLFKPPEQHTATRFSSASSSSTTPARTRLLPRSDDPLAVSHRRLRESARHMLVDAMSARGARAGASSDLVGDAVRGYGMPSREDVGAGAAGLGSSDSENDLSSRNNNNKKKKKKGKAGAKGKARTGEDDEDPHEGDDALSLAANRILLDAPDLWDVLGGTTARRERVRSREEPLLEVGAWELVRVLVKAWEDEAEGNAAQAKKEGQGRPEPLSLLRQFKPSASTTAARQLSSKALDVVFWPFAYATAGDESEDGSASEEDEDSEDNSARQRGRGKARRKDGQNGGVKAAREDQAKERAEADGTTLADKREAAIGDSAVQGYLDAETTVSEVVQRMKALSQDDFVALVELLPLVPTAPTFTTRLLTAYLETYSHPPAAAAQLHPTLSNGAPNITSASQPVSPRRLAATASLPKLEAAASAYWRVPSLSSSAPSASASPSSSSAQLIALAQRVPRDVPLRAAAAGSAGAGSAGTGKARSGPDGLSRRAQDETHRFVLVKEALVELLLAEAACDEAAGNGREEQERERVLRRVREAMDGVEEVVQAAGAKKA